MIFIPFLQVKRWRDRNIKHFDRKEAVNQWKDNLDLWIHNSSCSKNYCNQYFYYTEYRHWWKIWKEHILLTVSICWFHLPFNIPLIDMFVFLKQNSINVRINCIDYLSVYLHTLSNLVMVTVLSLAFVLLWSEPDYSFIYCVLHCVPDAREAS